ncbi:MAG: hypothetical protein K9L17_06435 [Clostridiales bacterium]|nr:hypothetical protein [Clostridiales bacterium]MCF8022309.1 hypothetical protein [Clostridiales bacterium]
MVNKKLITAFICAFIFVIMLGGCKTKTGWVGTNIPGHIKASFHSFTGIEKGTLNAQKGDSFLFEYSSQVESGDLVMKILSTDNKIIHEFKPDKEGSYKFTFAETGKYKVIIKGDSAKGSFNISWDKLN